ncbi:MAG: hypothetical protein ABEK36_03205 [Candidatus Aenigmatarchaeota archaeon]
MENDFGSWQEFEEYTRNILEKFRFEVEFRKVFKDPERKYEIDVIGRGKQFIICIDCKFYKNKGRVNALRKEAKKHIEKVHRLKDLEDENKDYIPLIITSLDDSMLIENSCLFIPHFKLNNFLNNIHIYLDKLNYSGSDDEFQRAN